MDADFSHDPATLPALVGPVDRRPRRPGHRLALHARVAASSIGASAGGSCRAAAACSPGRSCGLPSHDLTGGFKAWRAVDARRRPLRRRPCRRVCLPDRDDVPREPRRRPRPRGSDHVPRPAGRPVEDEPADHRGSAGRRRASFAPRSSAAGSRGRTPTSDATRRWTARRGAGPRPRPGRPRRSRRPAAAGTRPRASHCRLSRGIAGRVRRSTARGRIVRAPAPVRSRRSDRRTRTARRSSAGGCCHRPGSCARAR